MEAGKIKQIWANDVHQRTHFKNNDPDLAAALESNDDNRIEKIVGERLKAHFAK